MTSNSLTVESCQTYCSSKGWRYAGVEWGTECFCSSTITTGFPAGQVCPQACSGNSTELCGGAGVISIFNNTLSTASIAAPGAGPVSTAAGTYVGCVSEGNNNGRTLTGASTSSNNMTLEMCRSFCTSRGFSLSGTEYSSQCYCGNSFVNGGAIQSSDSTCNMLCAGNSMNVCGGPNRLSVYSATPAVSSSSSTMATVTKSAASASATVGGAAGSSSLSCPSNNGSSFSAAGSYYQLNCATDYAGNDLSMVYTSSIQACAAACSNTTGCLVSSWVASSPTGPCYMKSSAGSTVSNTGIWGIKKITNLPPKQCPADNGSTITVGTSSYTLQCATDHAGGDLAGTGSYSVEACAASCAATAGCVGASYLPGVCYMKKVNGPAMANNGVWALVLNAGSS